MWAVTPGGRVDTVGGDPEDHLADTDTDMDRFTI